MSNFSVNARFNESKHQMTTATAANGTPLPTIEGVQFGFMVKDTTAAFNQVALKSRYYDVIDYVRDHNVLNDIQAGDYAGNTHLMVSMERDGTVTVQVVPLSDWWALAPVDSVSVALPIDAGWIVQLGSTVYLDSVAKRVFEKARETFLVYT